MSSLTSTLRILLEDDGLATKAKADAEALKKLAAGADALKGLAQRNPQVQALTKQLETLRTTAGKLWSVHGDALLLIGPLGGVPIAAAAVAVLEPLAAGGRRVLEERDRTAFDALVPRLAAVGLRVDRRRDGMRIAKACP